MAFACGAARDEDGTRGWGQAGVKVQDTVGMEDEDEDGRMSRAATFDLLPHSRTPTDAGVVCVRSPWRGADGLGCRRASPGQTFTSSGLHPINLSSTTTLESH